MELKTVEDIQVYALRYPDTFTLGKEREIVLVLVNAIDILEAKVAELQKRETENRLLIEHEEVVRTTKAKSTSGGKGVEIKFKVGDIVEYNPIGTKLWAKSKVVSMRKRRFDIELLQQVNGVGLRGARRYVGGKQLRFYVHNEE
jgi:hypothetical protein